MPFYKTSNPKLLALNAIKLAYEESSPLGFGHLHYAPGGLPKEHLDHITNALDKSGEVSCDYVSGRMMKLQLKVLKDSVEYNDWKLSPDYQSWCRVYPTYYDLLEAASKVTP